MAVRDEIFRRIMERGWSERRQAFVQHEETEVLDASVLLMPLVGFTAPTDPRWLSTLDAIGADRVADSLVYRYDPVVAPDGLYGDEAPSRSAASGTSTPSRAPGGSRRRDSRSRRCSPMPTT